MLKNMAGVDRLVRAVVAALFVFVVYMGFIEGPMGWLLLAMAAVLFLTAVVGHCPVYKLIGIDSHVHDGHEHYGG